MLSRDVVVTDMSLILSDGDIDGSTEDVRLCKWLPLETMMSRSTSNECVLSGSES